MGIDVGNSAARVEAAVDRVRGLDESNDLVGAGQADGWPTRRGGVARSAGMLAIQSQARTLLERTVQDRMDFAHRVHLERSPNDSPLARRSPSDHATAGAVAVGLLFANRRWGIVAAVLAALMAFTRVYVGAHYVSDVAGLALGGLVVAVGWFTVVPVLRRFAVWLACSPLRPLVTHAERPAVGLSGISCEGRGLSVRGWKGRGGKDHIHGFEKD